MTNPGIAAELYLSTHTIKSHINRIFAKTGSEDRAVAGAAVQSAPFPRPPRQECESPRLGGVPFVTQNVAAIAHHP